MNLIQKIATQIEERITFRQANGYLPKKGKKLEDANIELWAGAYAGVVATKGVNDPDTEWVARVAMMLVMPRGYAETQEIAKAGREAEAAGAAALDLDTPKGEQQ